MKRIISAFLCLSLLLCGCGSAPVETIPANTDSAGNDIRTDESGTETKVLRFPCPIQYNNSILYLDSVDFYESYSEDTFSYFLYCIATFDVSNLTDAELHWLTEEDIDVVISYNEANEGFDYVSMSPIGVLHIQDTKKLVFSFAPSNFSAYRHSFSGKGIVLLTNVTQEETYNIREDLKSNVKNTLSYVSTIPENLPDAESIPEPIYSHMVECISRQNNFINSLY